MARGNNYGLGARDMSRAAGYVMQNEARDGNTSYSTAATVAARFDKFAAHAKIELGLRRMEQVRPEHVIAYGQQIADRVEHGELSASYAQNLVSAVNTVLSAASQGSWQSVSPTKDCQLPRRNFVRTEPVKGVDRDTVRGVAETLRNSGNDRTASIVELSRDLGLRSKEASLLNAKAALTQAQNTGYVTISSGTKGGRARTIPVSPEQQKTLERAAQAQGAARSLVPPEQSWKVFRAGELRDARETLQAAGIPRLHELRAAYAVERYTQLTGHQPQMMVGTAPRAADQAARLQISQELGHHRSAIANAYLGSARA